LPWSFDIAAFFTTPRILAREMNRKLHSISIAVISLNLRFDNFWLIRSDDAASYITVRLHFQMVLRWTGGQSAHIHST